MLNIEQSEVILTIPRAQLRESPFNPRKKYSEAALHELAETMRPPLGRIHSPIVARPLAQADIEHTHEVVFGHRRFRAAGIAGLASVPAVVREMTDEEVRVAQLIENAQREDVTAMEEADSLHELRRHHNVSIEELMQRTGKSRRYVFASLKLATAHDHVRSALDTGVIGSEVAKDLATLPNSLQAQALTDCTTTIWDEATKSNRRTALPARRVKEILSTRYRLKIADAAFDRDAINLIPDTPSCNACPRLSDNEPALLEDCGAGVCTNPDCYSSKSEAAQKAALEEAASKGWAAIPAAEARGLLVSRADMAPTGFTVVTELSGLTSLMGLELSYQDLIEASPDPIPRTVIGHPHVPGLVLTCISDEQAEALLDKNADAPKKPAPEVYTPAWLVKQREDDARYQAELEAMSPADRALMEHRTWGEVVKAAMSRVAGFQRTTEELRWVLLTELELADDFGPAEKVLGWEAPQDAELDDNRWRVEKVMAMSADELASLLVMVTIDRQAWIQRETQLDQRRQLAKAYAIDPLDPHHHAVEDVIRSDLARTLSPTPSTAARADEGADDEVEENAGEPASAPFKSKSPARYRNSQTGETWSGRGLMPKWLRMAINGGAKLQDFEAGATPSEAAQAPTGEVAETAGQQSLLADLACEEGQDQAGSAGRADEGAGDAGASDATCGATEPAEV
ncbi:ParB/RepB/Spo0J family partition protein [Mitsuaria sp. WAJ17]|uniref:ParB/RepB/Spo0J family partition protein n=1 Tax=Mitsuaria sp. WAJ17 TaxID=2761452 RepID=UPI001600D378|nr:ParB/RepB/Spo0J family partition protein [Mitsuaria sp. WAJ17]MBB2485433.1 ParB/RepB/Spo0J family partition protein [Mitsuaria sp. WAJ17]